MILCCRPGMLIVRAAASSQSSTKARNSATHSSSIDARSSVQLRSCSMVGAVIKEIDVCSRLQRFNHWAWVIPAGPSRSIAWTRERMVTVAAPTLESQPGEPATRSPNAEAPATAVTRVKRVSRLLRKVARLL